LEVTGLYWFPLWPRAYETMTWFHVCKDVNRSQGVQSFSILIIHIRIGRSI
jgi:hypothetical protein